MYPIPIHKRAKTESIVLLQHCIVTAPRSVRHDRRVHMVSVRLKVVLLTKDESDMIEPFLLYYGHIFGYSNIVVIDNGSAELAVLAAYERFASLGVTIRVDKRPFPQAVSFMSEHMRSISGDCDWILPLETDEFMFWIPEASNPDARLDPVAVYRYFESIPEDASILRYGEFWGSCVDPDDATYVQGIYVHPPRDMTRFYNQGWDKIAVRSSRFESMIQWCHHARVSSGALLKSDMLGLLHYHETGFRRQVDSAIRVIDSFRYVDRRLPLNDQLAATARLCSLGVACGHKIKYYDKLLRRRIALIAYRNVHGRLPASHVELDMFVAYADPETAVRNSVSSSVTSSSVTSSSVTSSSPSSPSSSASASSSSKPSWNELLYRDDHMPHRYNVHQVANFFLHRVRS